jgi:hypothetical protein
MVLYASLMLTVKLSTVSYAWAITWSWPVMILVLSLGFWQLVAMRKVECSFGEYRMF